MCRALLAVAAALVILPATLSHSADALAAPMGDYDAQHQWHDSDWWFHNNPDWVYRHHPDWIRLNVQWSRDGDWDAQHHWHSRSWWMHNDPNWVHRNHPDWH